MGAFPSLHVDRALGPGLAAVDRRLGAPLLRQPPYSVVHVLAEPQQATEPSRLTPQLWYLPVLTEANSTIAFPNSTRSSWLGPVAVGLLRGVCRLWCSR